MTPASGPSACNQVKPVPGGRSDRRNALKKAKCSVPMIAGRVDNWLQKILTTQEYTKGGPTMGDKKNGKKKVTQLQICPSCGSSSLTRGLVTLRFPDNTVLEDIPGAECDDCGAAFPGAGVEPHAITYLENEALNAAIRETALAVAKNQYDALTPEECQICDRMSRTLIFTTGDVHQGCLEALEILTGLVFVCIRKFEDRPDRAFTTLLVWLRIHKIAGAALVDFSQQFENAESMLEHILADMTAAVGAASWGTPSVLEC
jgi:hypothetical protein